VIAASCNHTEAAFKLIGRSLELLRGLPADSQPLLLPVALGFGRISGAGRHAHRRFLEQTFVTARRVKPAGAVAYALCDLAAAARDADDRPTSRRLLEESLSRFRELRDELGAAQALAQLGNLASTEGEHELAEELHEESLSLRGAANDARGIGLSLVAIAVAAANAGQLERARETAERALALFDRTDDGPGRASAVMELGFVAADAGRLQEAWELQERALESWRGFARNSPWCAVILLELAELDHALGYGERAPFRIQQAREIFAHVGDQRGVSYCEKASRTAVNAGLTPD
jgi:tetratricopeptide (TPR) repeat protein